MNNTRTFRGDGEELTPKTIKTEDGAEFELKPLGPMSAQGYFLVPISPKAEEKQWEVVFNTYKHSNPDIYLEFARGNQKTISDTDALAIKDAITTLMEYIFEEPGDKAGLDLLKLANRTRLAIRKGQSYLEAYDGAGDDDYEAEKARES